MSQCILCMSSHPTVLLAMDSIETGIPKKAAVEQQNLFHCNVTSLGMSFHCGVAFAIS